jgi:NAD(P)-dependent dehydrogenase (short-subunit alcohol dehydrogenase family)
VGEVNTIRILIIGANGGLGSHVLKQLENEPQVDLTASFRKSPASFEMTTRFKISICDTSNFVELETLICADNEEFKWDYILDFTGMFFAKTLDKSDFNDLSNTIVTNLISPIWIAKLALSSLNKGGHLIFCSSVIAQIGGKGSSAYAASKSGLETLVKSASTEFAARELVITAIRLSYYDAGMTHKLQKLIMNSSSGGGILDGVEIKSPSVISSLLLDSINGKFRFENGLVHEL